MSLLVAATILGTHRPQASVEITYQNRFAVLVASPDPEFLGRPGLELRGTKNDIHMIAELLHWKYGFPRSNIVIVGATRDDLPGYGQYASATMENALRWSSWLGKITKAGDYGVFYYSGHAYYLDNGKQADRPGSVTSGYVFLKDGIVFDYQLDKRLRQAQGKITEGFDCCYAGALYRGEEDTSHGTPKFLPAPKSYVLRMFDQSKNEIVPNRESYPTEGDMDTAIGASYDSNPSFENPVPDGKGGQIYAGDFTRSLYWHLWRSVEGQAKFGPTRKWLRSTVPSLMSIQRPANFGPPPGETHADWFVFAPPIQNRPGGAVPVVNTHLVAGALAGVLPNETLGERARGIPIQVVSTGPFYSELSRQPNDDLAHLSVRSLRLKPNTQWSKDGQEVQVQGVVLKIALNPKTGKYEVQSSKMTGEALDTSDNLQDAKQRLAKDAERLSTAEAMKGYLAPLMQLGSGVNVSVTPDTIQAGQEAIFKADLGEDSYILCFAIDPSGSINVFALSNDRIVAKETARTFKLVGAEPTGESTIYAVALPHAPRQWPANLPSASSVGTLVGPREVDAFWVWLLQQLGAVLTPGQDPSDPGAYELSDTAVRMSSVTILVTPRS